MRFSKFCVVFVLVAAVAFNVVVIWEAWGRGIPDALIYSNFTFLSAEGGLLAWLKIAERNAGKTAKASGKLTKTQLKTVTDAALAAVKAMQDTKLK